MNSLPNKKEVIESYMHNVLMLYKTDSEFFHSMNSAMETFSSLLLYNNNRKIYTNFSSVSPVNANYSTDISDLLDDDILMFIDEKRYIEWIADSKEKIYRILITSVYLTLTTGYIPVPLDEFSIAIVREYIYTTYRIKLRFITIAGIVEKHILPYIIDDSGDVIKRPYAIDTTVSYRYLIHNLVDKILGNNHIDTAEVSFRLLSLLNSIRTKKVQPSDFSKITSIEYGILMIYLRINIKDEDEKNTRV